MRLHRSILIRCLLATVVATTALADRIHDYAESLNYTGISNILREDPSLVNLKDSQGHTPLLCTVLSPYCVNANGLRKTIDVLLASHADINARDKDGNTVVHYAARQGLDSVKLFVALDHTFATATNNFQQTPLHTAVWFGQSDTAEFLIVSGAHVNARDKDGVTPLHTAAEKGNFDMVRLLLKYHADINARTNDGKTPYTLAYNDHDSTLQRFIRKHGGHE